MTETNRQSEENEERIIEIEIERLRSFKEHPFQVKDDKEMFLLHYQAYENLVKETIDYESLEVTHHDDMRQVDEIVNLIVETVMCKNDKILIASNWYPASRSCHFYTSQFLRSGSRFHLPVAYRHDGLLPVIHRCV